MLLENAKSSVWKLGCGAAGNIEFYREKIEKEIVANMTWKCCKYSWHNYYKISSFFAWPKFFQLDNPVPDPVETPMILNPIQIQKILNIRPDWTPKSGSCTPLLSCNHQRYYQPWLNKGRMLGLHKIYLTTYPTWAKLTYSPR